MEGLVILVVVVVMAAANVSLVIIALVPRPGRGLEEQHARADTA